MRLRYLEAKAAHDRKLALGTVSLTDTVEFARIEKKYNARRQRAEEEMREEWGDADIVADSQRIQAGLGGQHAVDEDT